jgi:hypothetical protein
MTESKYLFFVVGEPKPKTEVWQLVSKSQDALLGELKWYAPWRQYCFFPSDETVWSLGCLEDVLAFINGMKTRREIKQSILASKGEEHQK